MGMFWWLVVAATYAGSPWQVLDMDGDGHVDVAYVSRTGINVRWGHGDGTFDQDVCLSGPLELSDPDSARTVELDGKPTVVWQDQGQWWALDASGRAWRRRPVAALPPTDSVVRGDLDGDGVLETASVGASSTQYVGPWELQITDASGTVRQRLDLWEFDTFPGLWIGDLDGDGDDDLVVPEGRDRLVRFVDDGDGRLHREGALLVDLTPTTRHSLRAAWLVQLDDDPEREVVMEVGAFVWVHDDGPWVLDSKPYVAAMDDDPHPLAITVEEGDSPVVLTGWTLGPRGPRRVFRQSWPASEVALGGSPDDVWLAEKVEGSTVRVGPVAVGPQGLTWREAPTTIPDARWLWAVHLENGEPLVHDGRVLVGREGVRYLAPRLLASDEPLDRLPRRSTRSPTLTPRPVGYSQHDPDRSFTASGRLRGTSLHKEDLPCCSGMVLRGKFGGGARWITVGSEYSWALDRKGRTLWTSTQRVSLGNFVVGDIDDDGRDEIVRFDGLSVDTWGLEPADTGWALVSGPGGFAGKAVSQSGVVRDVDGDGIGDVVWTDAGGESNAVYWLRGSREGLISAPALHERPNPPPPVHVGDYEIGEGSTVLRRNARGYPRGLHSLGVFQSCLDEMDRLLWGP